MSLPYVSFLVPVYNTGRYLKKCLDTIINQTYGDIEIIIVDDGSTDHSPGLIEQYRRQDSRIKVITQPENRGLLRARIDAITAACGEYIVHVDSDDYVELDYAEKIVEYSRDFRFDMIAFQPYMEFPTLFAEFRKRFETRDRKKNYFPCVCCLKSSEDLFRAFLNQEITWECWGKAVRKTVAKKFSEEMFEYDEKLTFYEDVVQTTYLICNSTSYLCISNKMYHYRVNAGVTNIRFSDFEIYRKRLENYVSVRRFVALFIGRRGGSIESYKNSSFVRASVYALQNSILNQVLYISSEKRFLAYRLYMESVGDKLFADILKDCVVFAPQELPLDRFICFAFRYWLNFVSRNLKRLFPR